MKYVREHIHVVLAAILIAAVSFFAGRVAGNTDHLASPATTLENKEVGQPAEVDFSPFWTAWNTLNEKYVPATTTNTATDEEKVWGSIKGLADSLGDPYTVFLPPVEAEIFEGDVRGNFEGVGLEIGVRDNILTVIAPLKGTPADRAGIEAGDKIIEIDDVSTLDMTTDKAVSLIRGPGGSSVSFTIVREGRDEPFTVNVVRDVIDIPTINTELLPSGVFIIELYNFSAMSPNLFRDALREFINSKTSKLVIDLRSNPGGYLEAAIDMASWFLPPGKVIVREDFGGNKEERIYRSKGYNIFNDNLKLAILVDSGSASASEILAGALQEHGKATLVGSQTFGKGSVQELVKITPETSLKVTVARWLTPEGNSISDGGLTPDVVIEADAESSGDPQLEGAIEVLLSE